MVTIRVLVLASLVLALMPLRAAARCEGAVQLAGLHNAYRATVFETGQPQKLAATSLLVFVGQQSGVRLAEHATRAGVEASEERLDEILSDAETLAIRTLSGEPAENGTFHHGLNVQYLAELFDATGCRNSQATASQSVVGTSWNYGTGTNGSSDSSSPDSLNYTSLILPALFVGALVALFGAYKFYTSLSMRRRRVERLPRSPVSLSLTATFTSEDGQMKQAEVEALDISVGGMKVNWNDPPPPGTTVSFQLLQRERLCQVAWSNNFYAGIMFDEVLNKQELKTLKEA